MAEITLKIGYILTDLGEDKRYRVIAVTEKKTVTLCEMDTTRFNLTVFPATQLFNLIKSGDMSVEAVEDNRIFDENALSDSARATYQNRRDMMNEVIAEYEPTYLGLAGKKPRPFVKKLCKKYGITNRTFLRTCRLYFQNGMKTISLVNQSALPGKQHTEYNYQTKPGRPTEGIPEGIVRNDEVDGHFAEALQKYLAPKRKTTLRGVYDDMVDQYYMMEQYSDGEAVEKPLPPDQRPSLKQFYYYAETHMTKEQKRRKLTSDDEYDNNEQLLLSRSDKNVYGAGDVVELDAMEADVSLVSSTDPNRTVGRPIVYVAIDVKTEILLAISVGFDNNSILGLTNLLLNLVTDKQEFCRQFGVEFDNPDMWPSGILPRKFRVDRGSDFTSNEFQRMCHDLGITIDYLAPARGSKKAVVEHWFDRMNQLQDEFLEGKGGMSKRYDSNHHKEACLTLYDYVHLLLNNLLTYHQETIEGYDPPVGMIKQHMTPTPINLWKYWSSIQAPKPITDPVMFKWTMMMPIKVSVYKQGLRFRDLYYVPDDDPDMIRLLSKQGTSRKKFDMRIDPHCVNEIYYIKGQEMMRAVLNPAVPRNMDYMDYTLKEYLDTYKDKQTLLAEGRIQNEELRIYNRKVNRSIVEAKEKPTYSNDKNMREAREIEKQNVSASKKIKNIPIDKNLSVSENALQEHQPPTALPEAGESRLPACQEPEKEHDYDEDMMPKSRRAEIEEDWFDDDDDDSDDE